MAAVAGRQAVGGARCLEQCSCAWHSMQLFPTRAVLSSAGSLPESWGDDGAFPALTEL